MNKNVKTVFRRLIAVFAAIIIAAGIILSQSPGHLLKATALTDAYYDDQSIPAEEEAPLGEEQMNIVLPSPEEAVQEEVPESQEIVLPPYETAPEPVTESVPEPAAEPAPEPVTETVPELVTEPVPEPVTEAVPEPAGETEPEPAAESEAETGEEALQQVTITYVVEGSAPEEVMQTAGELIRLPVTPVKEGFRFIGWFADDNTEINEEYIVTDDMILTARFTQDWIVSYIVDGVPYTSLAVENNAQIGQFPAAPEKDGARFLGWFSGGHKASETDIITSDMTLEAMFGYTVRFVAEKDETEEVLERTVDEGQTLGSLPSDPFWEGHAFLYWIDENGSEVTADTVVTSDMTVRGVYESINIYKITVDYFYNDAAGVYHNIDRTVVTVDSRRVTDAAPVQITSPPQYEIREDGGVAAGIIYYPATQTTIITPQDLAQASETREIELSVEYSAQAVHYSLVYLLKDLHGDSYSEMERTEGQAVIGSLVTPEVKNYLFAQQGVTQPYQIERDGQELPVYYERNSYSLIFDSEGRSQVTPVTVPYGTSVDISEFVPERTGYDFAGWYLDRDLTRRAGDAVTVENRTTLYAKWTGREVGYTIVYMKEKYDNATGGSTYVYDNSRTARATVGKTVYASDAPRLTNNINGYEADSAANASSSVRIAADGSSVLTVYYKLIRYSLTFTHRTSGYGKASLTINGGNYTNSKYSISGVVIGQDISGLWPSQVNSGVSNYSFTGWSYTNESGGTTNRVTKVTELTWELVARANSSTHSAAFSANYKKGVTNKSVEYWLQQPDGTYAKDAVLSQEYASTGTLGAKDINGYSKHDGDAGAPAGYSGSSGNTSRFYYDRNSYNIEYYDGGTKLDSRNSIFFDSDISSAEFDFIPDAPAGEEEYTWGGWYSDSSLNTKFSFNRMPANHVVLYANWIPPQYTVNFHCNYEGADICDSQTVSRDTPAEEPQAPVREYYRFVGWFTEAEGGRQYLAGSESVRSDLDLYAHWEIIPLKYTVRYIDRTTGEILFSEKEVESPAFTPGQQISEDAVVIAGYIPYDSRKSIELGYRSEENLITFEYETKSDHMLTYTVEYVLLEDPSVHVADSRQVTVGGTYASITETAVQAAVPEYRNYNPVEITRTLQLGLNSESNILTFYYAPRGAVVNTRWLDMDGNPVPGLPGTSEFYKVGSTFTVNTAAQGYTLHHIEDDLSQGHVNEEYTVRSNTGINITVYMQKNLTIRAKSKSKVYDGEAISDSGVGDVTVSGLEAGHTLESITISGSQTLAGTSEARPSDAVISGITNPEYYKISYVSGSLTVILTKVTINIEPDRWNDGPAYDGTPRTIGFRSLRNNPDATAGVTINNSVYEEKYGRQIRDMVRDITLTEKDAGFYTIPASMIRAAITLPDDPGFSVVLNIRDGELTIPKAPVTVTTGSASKLYDGRPLTAPEASVEGLADGETAEITATGEITDAGSVPNDYVIRWGSAKESNYEVVSENEGTLEVAKRNVTLTSGSAVKEYDGQPLRVDDVTVEGDGFADGEGASFSVSGSQLIAGSSSNSFDYSLNEGTDAANYNISKAEGILQITDRSVKYEITVRADSAEVLYDGQEHTLEGIVQSEFEIGGNLYTVSGLSAKVSAADAGSYVNAIAGTPVVRDAAGNDVTDQFAVNLENGMLGIAKRSVILTSESASGEYDGNALENSSVTVSGDGFADGEGASYEFSGSQTLAGSSENTFEYSLDEGTKADNYNISVVYGNLTVLNRNAKYGITVTANSGEYKYDGTEKTVNGVVSSQFTVDGHAYTVEGLSASAAAADAGEYVSHVTGSAVVLDENGNDVTAQFAVNTLPGTLVIARRDIVFTSADDCKEYDGLALANHTVTVSGDGFAPGEGASFSVAGTRTLTGESENSFTYTFNEGTKAENYTVSTAFGTLKVIERGQKFEITVKAVSSTGNMYDGSPKQAAGFETLTFTLNGVDYTVSGLETTDPVQTDAGTYPNAVSGDAVVLDPDGNDVTENFEVKTEDGTLEILKRKVSLASGSAAKEYDGQPLTCENVEVTGDGFADGEGASFEVSGSRTLTGSSANTFTYSLNDETNADNYEITVSEGTLEVRTRSVKYRIAVKAAGRTVLYDGSKQEAEGLENDTFVIDGNTYQVEGLEAKAAGTDAGITDVFVTGTAKVLDRAGNDVTEEFIVDRQKGSLSIEKRMITLSSVSESKKYDGSALTFTGREENAFEDGSITVSGDGFAQDEGADVAFTGSQTLPGTSANEFAYTLKEGTKADNYEIAVVYGSLSVTDRDEEERFTVTLQGKSDEVLYDGTEHSIDGFVSQEFVINGNTYTVEGLSSGTEAVHTGVYTAQIFGAGKVFDSRGNDVTEQFAVQVLPGTLTIRPRTVTLVSASAEKEYDGTALTDDRITVEGDGFAQGEGAEYEFGGAQTVSGSCENIFSYTLQNAEETDYLIDRVFGTLRVTDRNARYEIRVKANGGEYLYDGYEHDVSGITLQNNDQDEEGKIRFSDDNGVEYVLSGLSASAQGRKAGVYPVSISGMPVITDTAGNDVTEQFHIVQEGAELRINRRSVILTSDSDTKQYDGDPLKNETVAVSGDGFAEGEGVDWRFTTPGITLPGSAENAFVYAAIDGDTDLENYEIRTVFGTLTVTNRDALYQVTVKARSGEFLYNGLEQTVSGLVSTKFKINGKTYTVEGLTAQVSAKHAGSYTAAVTGSPAVFDTDGNDVTDQFAVSTEDGTLEIRRRNVVLVSSDAGKVYDGGVLVNEDVTVAGDGFAPGEGVDIAWTGSRLLPGVSENSFRWSFAGETLAGDYNVSEIFGTLTVAGRESDDLYSMTVTAPGGTFKYDGQPHEVSGLTGLSAKINGHYYSVEGLEAALSETDAGTYDVIVSGMAKVSDEEGNDVTDQFAVKTVNGILEIVKREVVLTSASVSHEYDGNELSCDTVEISGDGFAEGEGAEFTVTGIQRIVGSSSNTFDYSLQEGTKAGNYNITKVNGTLAITSREAKYEIVVRANSLETVYDGSEKTVSGIVETEFVIGENTYTVEGLSAQAKAADAGSYPVEITGTPVVRDDAGSDVTDQFSVIERDGTLTISPRTVILTSEDASKQYDGTALTGSAVTVSGDGFAEGEGADYEFTGSQLLTGSSENVFTYSLHPGTEAGNYDIRTVFGTLNVLNRDALYQITVKAVSGKYKYNGQTQGVEGLIETEFDIDGNTYTVSGLTAQAEAVHAGTYRVPVTGTPVVSDAAGNDVSAQFAVTAEEGTLEITRRSVIITSASSAKVYDGEPLVDENVSYSGDGFVSGEGAEITFTGKQLLPGVSDNTFSRVCAENTTESDYDIKEVYGKLEVADRDSSDLYALTVTAESGEFIYDGNAHTVSGLRGLGTVINGHTYTAEGLSAEMEQTDAGSYIVEVTGDVKVTDEAGNDVTAQFAVETVNGKLEITKRNVVLTSMTVSKEYDGKALTSSVVEVSGDGFAQGEGAEFSVTGKQQTVGTSLNTFSYTLNEGTKAENYNITKNEGTLSITNREAKYEITVRANSLNGKYDGSEKTVSGFEAEEFEIDGNRYTVEGIAAEQAATDAGSYPVVISGTPKVVDADGNDVTGQFVVNLENGTINIGKRSVIMTSDSASKEYDGDALVSEKVEISGDGFAQGEGADYTFSGSQLTAGMSSNTFTYALAENTREENYDITIQPGTLTVTNRQSRYEIEVAANSGEFLYDGTEKTVDGFASLRFGIGGNVYTVEGLSASRSETHAGTYTIPAEGTPVVRDGFGNDVTDQFRVTARAGTLTITPREVVLTSESAVDTYIGRTLRNPEVHVGGDGFAGSDGVTVEVTGSRTIAGISENTFSYVLNEGTRESDYLISTVFGTLTVLSRAEDARFEITVKAESGSALYDGESHRVSGISINGIAQDENGSVPFEVDGVGYVLSGLGAEAEAVNAGEYAVNVTGNVKVSDEAGNDVTDQFIVIPENGKLEIARRSVILTSGSAAHAYTGRTLTNENVEVSGDGFASGEGAVYTVTGSRTIPGISKNTFTYVLNDNTRAENYDICEVLGTLTVANRDAEYVVTVRALSGEFLYDGTEKTVEGLERTDFTVDGHHYVIRGLAAAASAADAGEYAVKVYGTPAVYDEEENDVTDQFTIEAVDGTMKILPRTVIFTSENAAKEYDGRPLSSPAVTVSGDGFAAGEGAEFFAESSRTLVGTSENTFTWTLHENTKAENYIIQTVFGTLNVVNREAAFAIELVGNSLEVLYDGAEHEVSGFESLEFEIEGNRYRAEGIEAIARGTQSGIYSSEFTGRARVLDAEGNDVTDQFAVSIVPGRLTIKANYLLQINYVDEEGTALLESFSSRYQPGETFGPFIVPKIEGFITDHETVVSPEGGMPEQDIAIDIIYRKAAERKPAENEMAENEAAESGAASGIVKTDHRRGTVEIHPGSEKADIISIEDPQIPLASAEAGYWALLNLLLVLATVFAFILMLTEYLMTRKKKEENSDEVAETGAPADEEEKDSSENYRKVDLKAVLLGIIPAIGSIVAFLLTEDMTNSVRLADIWTILMIVIFVLELLLLMFGRRRKETKETAETT